MTLKETDLTEEDREAVLEKAAGMWHGRDDIPDAANIRSEWDRDRQP